MTTFFLDSSALIKRYVAERGTLWLRSITAQTSLNRIIISQITPVEVISGISRRRREGHLSVELAQTMRLLLELHSKEQYIVIGLTAGITSLANELLEKHPLRAYDAVQLASALLTNAQFTSAGLDSLAFLTADARLLEVATIEGLATDDPNQHS